MQKNVFVGVWLGWESENQPIYASNLESPDSLLPIEHRAVDSEGAGFAVAYFLQDRWFFLFGTKILSRFKNKDIGKFSVKLFLCVLFLFFLGNFGSEIPKPPNRIKVV